VTGQVHLADVIMGERAFTACGRTISVRGRGAKRAVGDAAFNASRHKCQACLKTLRKVARLLDRWKGHDE